MDSRAQRRPIALKPGCRTVAGTMAADAIDGRFLRAACGNVATSPAQVRMRWTERVRSFLNVLR